MSNWQPPPGQPPQGPFPPGQFPPGQPRPYQPPASSFYGPPPRPKSQAGVWIALAICGVLLLACGGGCVGVMLFGLNVAEQEMIALLRDNPKLREHIGEIETLDMDMAASLAEEDDVFVYRVKGNKGSGTLTVQEGMDDDFDTTIESALLRLPDGTKVEIVP